MPYRWALTLEVLACALLRRRVQLTVQVASWRPLMSALNRLRVKESFDRVLLVMVLSRVAATLVQGIGPLSVLIDNEVLTGLREPVQLSSIRRSFFAVGWCHLTAQLKLVHLLHMLGNSASDPAGGPIKQRLVGRIISFALFYGRYGPQISECRRRGSAMIQNDDLGLDDVDLVATLLWQFVDKKFVLPSPNRLRAHPVFD